jgi:hypothetical protein
MEDDVFGRERGRTPLIDVANAAAGAAAVLLITGTAAIAAATAQFHAKELAVHGPMDNNVKQF